MTENKETFTTGVRQAISRRVMETQRLQRQLRTVLTGDQERDTRNVALLMETVQRFDSSEGVDTYLNRVLDMIVEMTRADRGLLLLRRSQGELEVAAARDREGLTIGDLAPYGESLARESMQTMQSICVVDLPNSDVAVTDTVRELKLKTLMCVPIVGQVGAIGAVYVDSRFKTREFSDADLRFFEAICMQLAVAVEQARLTRRVVETEGLAVIGSMTTRLIEELSQPARVLQGSAAMLRNFELEPDDVKRLGAEVETFVQAIFGMLRSAQDYALVREPVDFARVDAEDFVRATLQRMMPLMTERRVACFVGAPSTADVLVDADMMEHALRALVHNAVEAMGEEGKLSARVQVTEDGQVSVELSDSGPGLPPELEGNPFEPFVTCGKPNHVGLGLSTAQAILDRHDGHITLRSGAKKGAIATIYLPVAKAAQ